MYKISVILPVYNVEKTINSAFDSLLNQTIGFSNLEIIFVDDCSTDNSANIIKNLMKKYSNIKYYKLDENSGVGGKPRNLGITYATSKYVMFLDPDDTYYEDACELLYVNMISNNVDMVSGNFTINKNNTRIKAENFENYMNIHYGTYKIQNIRENTSLLKLSPAVWTKIFKRSFLINNKIEFLEYVPAEDLYFVYKALINANGIMYIDENIVYYDTRTDENESMSVTSIRNNKMLIGYIYAYRKLFHLLNNFDNKLGWIASMHLYFGSIQFVHSTLSKSDKLEFLSNARNLYKVFMNNGKLKPFKNYENLFKLILNNKLINAINVSEQMKYYLDDNKKLETDLIYYLLINKKEKKTKLDNVMKKYELLRKNNYDIILVEIDINSKINRKNIQINYSDLEISNKQLNIKNKRISISDNSHVNSSKNTANNLINKLWKNKILKDESDLVSYIINRENIETNRDYGIINEYDDNLTNSFNLNSYEITLPNYDKSNNFFKQWKESHKNYYWNKINDESKIILLNETENKKNNLLKELNKLENNQYKTNYTVLNKLKTNKQNTHKIFMDINERYAHKKTTLEYYKLKSKIKKKLLLFLPYLYIIYKHENILTNFKLYSLLQDNNWFNTGYYLNKNSDISRNKWCKLFTPETHYVCHGHNEKRKPNHNYDINLTKKEIIKQLEIK